jgi:hypothetical protein
MRRAFRRPGLIVGLVLALGLGACLTSDPPKIAREDLVQIDGLAGNHVAVALPEGAPGGPPPSDAEIVAREDGSYLLTFIEDGHRDAPNVIRLLAFGTGTYLGILTDDKPDSAAMYALVSRDAAGLWEFRAFDLLPERRTDDLQPILARHGAGKISFEDLGTDPKTTNDRFAGSLDAAQLRALFSDPDFTAALHTDTGFRLQPKP